MDDFGKLINEVKSDIEDYLRRAYNLGAASIPEDDQPIIDPLPPPTIIPAFPINEFEIVEWEGDTYCCKLRTWEEYKKYKNNFLFAGTYYVVREVAAPIIFKRYGLETILYDLSAGHMTEAEGPNYNRHPPASHAFAGFDKQYFGWPSKLLVKPEWEFVEICKLCFGDRYECRTGAMEKAAMELVAHRSLSYVFVEPGHGFLEHSHHRSDIGGQKIEKEEVKLLMYEL